MFTLPTKLVSWARSQRSPCTLLILLRVKMGFSGGSVVKNLTASAGDAGSIPGSGRSPGGRNGNPLQYSCLGNPMDRDAWQATEKWLNNKWVRDTPGYWNEQRVGLRDIDSLPINGLLWASQPGSYLFNKSGELGTSFHTSLRACKEFPTTKKPGRKPWELGTSVTPYSQHSCSQLLVLGHRVKVVESGEFWVTLQNTSYSSSSLSCLRLSAPQICVVGTFPGPMWGIIRNAPLLNPIPSWQCAFRDCLSGRAGNS